MNITREADYALRVVYYLASKDRDLRINAKTISEENDIPVDFLLKILRKLVKAGLIESHRGIRGGYVLNQKPENISLKDVIEVIDGSIFINHCLNDSESCSFLSRFPECPLYDAFNEIQLDLTKKLASVNFKALVERRSFDFFSAKSQV